MVWWNIFGATISHVLCINCVSMTHGWRTCDAYGAWMAMPLRMMSRMRTWPLRIHGASGVCTANIPRTRGGQRDSMAHGGRMYFRMGCVHAKLINTHHYMWGVSVTFKWPCSLKHMYLNVQFHLSNLIWHVYHRNDIVLTTGRIICKLWFPRI